MSSWLELGVILREEEGMGADRIVIQRFNNIVTRGMLVPGLCPAVDPDRLPDWIRSDHLLAAQAAIHSHIGSLSFASLSGLLIILQTPFGFDPMIQTGRSATVAKLFIRYLDTLTHFKSWYTTDLLDPNSDGNKSIRRVRVMHANAMKKMETVPCRLQDMVWMSQSVMSMTQWAFVGLVFAFPKECGIHEESVLVDINYLWRVIGYLNGIEDQYNMCFADVRHTISMCNLMFRKFFLPILGSKSGVSELGYEMRLDIVTSLQSVTGGASGKVFLNYWYTVFGMESDQMPQLLFRDQIMLRSQKLAMNFLFRYRFIRLGFGMMTDKVISWYHENRIQHYNYLRKAYPEAKYSTQKVEEIRQKCPFDFAEYFKLF